MRQHTLQGRGSGAVMIGMALLCAGMIGCAETPRQGMVGVQERSTAEQSYRQQAEAARAEAERYEGRAASLGEYSDTKGFVRSGLINAAQAHRAKAEKFDELASTQEEQQNTANR